MMNNIHSNNTKDKMLKQDMLSFPFVVLDLETTGLKYTECEIIEIGAIRFQKDGTQDVFSVLIKPVGDVPHSIYQLTKIKPQELQGAAKAKKVLTQLLEFLHQNDLLVCHNVDFDIKFLNYHLQQHQLPILVNKVLDTVTLARIFLPFLHSHSLLTLSHYFQINNENAHRAIYDAEATGKILLSLMEFIDKNIKPEDISFLVTILEFKKRFEPKKNMFLRPGTEDYLLEFLTQIRDYLIKYALIRKPITISPFIFDHYNYLDYRATEKKSPIREEAKELFNTIFGLSGPFPQIFANYELRKGQIAMAESVYNAFTHDQYLVVEAGTGVGKSLAYLIPAFVHAKINEKKVVISTNTKNLQEQLMFKDIPLMLKALDHDFSVVLVKGRENYLCKRKWQDLYESFLLQQPHINISPTDIYGLLFLFFWVINTQTGDITENHAFQNSGYQSIWKKIASDRHLCLNRKCRFYESCFLMVVRQKIQTANLLVINHSLLFADFQAEQASLGNVEYLVLDEAHNLLQTAPSYVGFSLSYPDLNSFISSIYYVKDKYQYGMLPFIKNSILKSMIPETDKETLLKQVEELQNLIDSSLSLIANPFRTIGSIARIKGAYQKLRIKDLNENEQWVIELNSLQNFIFRFNELLKILWGRIMQYESRVFADQESILDFLTKSSERILEFEQQLSKLLEPNLKQFVYWFACLDNQQENYPLGIFNYCPIMVNEILPNLIYSRLKSIIFTSATLSLRGSFKYFVNQLGLNIITAPPNHFDVDSKNGFEVQHFQKIVNTKIVDSPFNYDEQSLILNTTYLPDHRHHNFFSQSSALINEIITKVKIGSLILFTSYKDLNLIYEAMENTCFENDILLLKQSFSGNRSSILNQFKTNGKAILLGTNSFWEGIDVQGESLSLLIMYKLPFQVPSEPIVEAILEKLKQEDKDYFIHYLLPNALLRMRQGIGRLIRSKTDRGVILILDNRISKKDYGKYFHEIFPTKIHKTMNATETINFIIKKLLNDNQISDLNNV